MGFSDFIGNEGTVRRLREAIALGRLPNSLILTGPRGAGKYTLAVMLAQAANCLVQPMTDGQPDFCGSCSNCSRIGQALPLEPRVEEAIAAREELRETDKKETRVLVQTHPDVLVIPPDPPQLLIKLGQVRTVVREIYRMPGEARRAMYIFTSAAFMKEAANSLLKVLEEPPAYATIILLAENTGELLPTIRSRAQILRLGALPLEEIERLLAERRSDWKPAQRALVARLAEGAVGRALKFNLEGYLTSRQDALLLLRSALAEPDHSALFRMTEAYRAGAEGQEKTSGLLRAVASLLEDLMLLLAGQPTMVRNIDLERELGTMSQSVSLTWIESAVKGMHQVESGMRRNLLRSLSLDSFAAGLGGQGRG
ncbi:MAG: DNA polymerase III subunit delta' [Acidobacteria bacterium]|nr:DNA polymerase III subunit delta' [Acidobacteriota bacterium]